MHNNTKMFLRLHWNQNWTRCIGK